MFGVHTFFCLACRAQFERKRTPQKCPECKSPNVQYVSHALVMPQARYFTDLFEKVAAWEPVDPGKVHERAPLHRKKAANGMPIGDYCTVSGLKRYSLRVVPTDALVEATQPVTFPEGDSIYFEIVIREGGDALVIWKHNQILAQRWITIIPAAQVPTFEDEDAGEDEDAPTFKIVRFYRDDRPSEDMQTGLTREEAKAHCSSPMSKGEGWFDGFTEE